MGSVSVVTDTTCYLPEGLRAAEGIDLVSLYVSWSDRSEREIEILDYDAFFDTLRGMTNLPGTSQPSVGDFLDAYRPLLDQGKQIYSIHLSGGISGTVESARQAKAQLEREGVDPGSIAVVDSRSACGGLGLMALIAGRHAKAGADLATVRTVVDETRATLDLWFAVDTLEFLRRGGRIGAASAWIGSTLKIKPILTIAEEITPVERVRTSGRAFDRMVEYCRRRKDSGTDAWVVQHIQAPDVAQRLTDACREIMGSDPVFVSEVGPVIGAHVGPGLLGFGAVDATHVNP